MKSAIILALIWLLVPTGLVCGQQPDDFRAIDRHARRAPEELSRDLPALTAYLVEAAGDERARVRAIYSWIIRNIRYEEETEPIGRRRVNQNLGDILRRRQGICVDFAALFQAMCREAGLVCEIVGGYSREAFTAAPDSVEPDHAWNAVRIDQQWRLLDATWDNSPHPSGELPFFLPDPARFVETHLPAMPMWQLLDCPVPAEIFRQSEENIAAFLTQADSCFSYRDSIRAWRNGTATQRRQWEAETSFRFLPTAANRNQLGHAWMDVAGDLSDLTDALQPSGDLDSLIRVQARMLDACAQARLLADTLYPWQQELQITTLINQAVALFQRAAAHPDTKADYPAMLALLREARRYIDRLPPQSLYAEQLRRQCEQYLEVLEENRRV